MNGEQRRAWILQQLQSAEKPISATALAKQSQVSRQIIVGDIALLRAAGESIEATPRGYRIADATKGCTVLLACCHSQPQQLQQELYLVVDNGGTVEDVIVENPLYGQITAQLHITSRYDADLFLQRAAQKRESLLSNLTGGVHLHTIRCKDKETMQRIADELKAAGLIYQQDKNE